MLIRQSEWYWSIRTLPIILPELLFGWERPSFLVQILTEYTLANLLHTDDINILIHPHEFLGKRLCCLQYVAMTHYHGWPSRAQRKPRGPTLRCAVYRSCGKTPAIFSLRLRTVLSDNSAHNYAHYFYCGRSAQCGRMWWVLFPVMFWDLHSPLWRPTTQTLRCGVLY
jgi:hypothetical protein